MLNYTEKQTKNPHLFRLVDESGNWNHYVYYSKTNQQGKKSYLRSVNHILRSGFAKGPYFEKYLRDHSKDEIETRLNEAGDKGDMVHRLAEVIIRDGKIDRSTTAYDDRQQKERVATNDEWKCMISFAAFLNAHEAKIHQVELPLFNLSKKYAGTTDLVLTLNKACGNRYCKCKDYVGKLGLYDTKSGGEWQDHGPQLGAYAGCPNLKDYTNGKPIEYTANLYVGRDTQNGYKLCPYDGAETVAHQKEFLAAITIHNASYRPFEIGDIVDLPDELTLIKKHDTNTTNL